MSYPDFDALQYRMRTLPAERVAQAQHDHLVANLLAARPVVARKLNLAALFQKAGLAFAGLKLRTMPSRRLAKPL